MKFNIYSKDGTDFGTYEADSKDDAFLAMIHDAGSEVPTESTGTADDWDIVEVDA